MKLFFSTAGRISPTTFLRAAIVLIALNILVIFSVYLGPAFYLCLNLVFFLSIWCWISLWVKRYHDGGMTGWYAIFPMLAYIAGAVCLSFFLTSRYGIDVNQRMLFNEKIQEAATLGNMEAVRAMTVEMTMIEGRKLALPNAILTAGLGLSIVWFFNSVLIVQDPDPNRFGDLP